MEKIGVKVLINAITIFRLVFTFAMPFLIKRVSHIAFLIIVAILFFTDCVDGVLARVCKAQTLFGSIMDTIADKVLNIILIVCISGEIPVLYIVFIGEIIIATINLLGTINGAPIRATMLGKSKMWVIAIAILLGYMYYFDICDKIYVNVVGIIVIIMQIILFFSYGNKARETKEFKLKKLVFKKGQELKKALFDTEYYLSTIDVPLSEKLTVNQ